MTTAIQIIATALLTYIIIDLYDRVRRIEKRWKK